MIAASCVHLCAIPVGALIKYLTQEYRYKRKLLVALITWPMLLVK